MTLVRFLCKNQATLILVKLFSFLPATLTVLSKSGNIYLLFNKHPCSSALLDFTVSHSPALRPSLLIYPGLSKNNKVEILVADTKCELLPVVCRDKPGRSGGYQGGVWLCRTQLWEKPGLTWTLPGTRWPGRAKGWERLRGRDKPLKGNGRAVLSFLGLLQHLFVPSADSPAFQRKSHRLGCLHVPVSSWRTRKRNLNTF